MYGRRNTFNLSLYGLFLIYFKCSSLAGVKSIGHDTTVTNGGNATLLCHLTETEENLTHIVWQKHTRGNPERHTFFIIHRDGKTEHQSYLQDKVKFVGDIKEKNGSIRLLGMSLLDDGIYTCIFNTFPSGQILTNINVTVHDPPELVVIIPDDPTEAEEYHCLVDCNPTPTSYIWIKVNGSTPHSEGNKLFIPKSSSDLNGVYICTASNEYGRVSGVLYVDNTGSTDICWGLLGLISSCAILGFTVVLFYTVSRAQEK
ncbi:hypothetical protein R3I93_004802 [Phoxinus phoxinus]|uniref:Ig-like domain-containing protein n=1 Tax=Phoxinus phoxinus TaxID=58324 RepID=A0AAN9HC43_9TELE